MIEFNGDVIFADGSGQVRTLLGDLTLRADITNSRDIIIGSGASLRPEKDVAIDLGTSLFRWHKLFTGNMAASSGVIGGLAVTNNQIDISSNQFNIASATVLFNAVTDITIGGTAGFGTLGRFTTRFLPSTHNTFPIGSPTLGWSHIFAASGVYNALSPVTSGGLMFLQGHLIPGNQHHQLGTVNNRWGNVYATSGNFTQLDASDLDVGNDLTVQNDAIIENAIVTLLTTNSIGATTGTSINILNNLVPFDANGNYGRLFLGFPSQRWGAIHAVSGVFNAISPPTSGTFINIHGTLIPGRTDLYALGTNINKWSVLNATSGELSFINASTIKTTVLNLDTSPTINLVSTGPLAIDANGADINFSNVAQIDFGNTSFMGITTIAAQSAIFSSTSVATTFAKRPTVNGSGVALAEENYFEVYGGRFLNLGSTTNGTLRIDPDAGFVAGADDLFINNRDVRLTGFVINTQHLNGSQPADWVLRLRINEETTDRCSGLFTWAPTNSTNRTTVGRWIGNATLPSGSRAHLIIDNDGGAAIGIVYAKAWVGMTISGVQ